MQGDFGKVYLGNDKPYSIVGKGGVQINQKNETVLKLKDVRHVPNLKKNLISVGQLSKSGYVITFTSELWKMTKGAMVMARGKKEGTLYVTSDANGAISVASSGVDTTTWHYRLGHMSEKGMKVLLSRGKLSGLESIDLGLCEDCIFGK